MITENGTTKQNVTSGFYVATAFYVSVITFCSVLFNSMACYILATKFQGWKPQMRILFSMFLGDAIAPAIAYPLVVYSNAVKEWSLGGKACSYYAFTTSVGGIGSIYHLVLLSAERYIGIVYPFAYQEITRTKNVTRGLIIAWSLATVSSVFPLFGWSSYKIEGVGTSCSFDLFAESWSDKSFGIYLITVAFAIPITMIFILNLGFLKVVFKLTECPCRKNSNQREVQHSAVCQLGKDRKIANQMCILVIALLFSFLSSWLPYAIVSALGIIGKLPRDNAIAISVPSYFAKSYTIYDPLLYFFLDKKFRNAVKRVCCGNTRTEAGDIPPTGIVTVGHTATQGLEERKEDYRSEGRQQDEVLGEAAEPFGDEILSINAMIAQYQG
ncbi:rhodopsin-like [Rhopilema esculentum]|uniref:rhodopsin-like n=1 Tax=Rhopilema esculentum TaxID=499914 RepID=UPI0031D57356